MIDRMAEQNTVDWWAYLREHYEIAEDSHGIEFTCLLCGEVLAFTKRTELGQILREEGLHLSRHLVVQRDG